MPEDQSVLAGLDGVLELLQRMMASLEERLAPSPPPSGMLARLLRLLSGQALADQTWRAVGVMLRAKLALFASSLSASVMADLQSHGTSDGPAQDAAELPSLPAQSVLSRPRDACALAPCAPPLACVRGDADAASSIGTDVATPAACCGSMVNAADAVAITGSETCGTHGVGAAASPGSGAGSHAPFPGCRDADAIVAREPEADGPGRDEDEGRRARAHLELLERSRSICRRTIKPVDERKRRLVRQCDARVHLAGARFNGGVSLRVAGPVATRARRSDSRQPVCPPSGDARDAGAMLGVARAPVSR